ncbi:MAG: hypothetical protein WC620_08025 [Methanoregula sp.]|jgi:hypothetical protein
MTNLGDVIRQVERSLCDTKYPPTDEEQEALHIILISVYIGDVDAQGSR